MINGVAIMQRQKHNLTRRSACAMGVSAAGAAILSKFAHSTDAYPNRPIRLIVPFAAGSPIDIIARLLSEKLTATLKQSVFVEKQAGCGREFGRGGGS